MKLEVEDRWRGFVEQIVREGRYGSADEVATEGLRLVEENERKLVALREMVEASIARGGEITEEELDKALAARAAQFEARDRQG